jgi:hypothetical protein
VRLEPAQLEELARVLERIDEGTIATPRVKGPIGQFIREYADAKLDVATRLGVPPSARTWVSGESLGPLTLVPITEIALTRGNELMGSVASVIAGSETVGTTFRVSLWSAARTANRLQRVWRRDPARAVTLRGPYRWYPPSRITPGEAATEELPDSAPWNQMRFLKYTGDDLARSPRAATLHLDWLTPPPGIKAFRAFVARRDGAAWQVVPGLRDTNPGLSVAVPRDAAPRDCHQILALGYSEPWAPERWTVVDAVVATDDDVLAHNLAWADYVRELRGEGPVSTEEIGALTRRLREIGINPRRETAAAKAALERSLTARARELARWLRGVS